MSRRFQVIGGLPGDYRHPWTASTSVRCVSDGPSIRPQVSRSECSHAMCRRARKTRREVIGGLPGDYRGFYPPDDRWYVEPMGGDDEGDGTEERPLRTFGELARRLSAIVREHRDRLVDGEAIPQLDLY